MTLARLAAVATRSRGRAAALIGGGLVLITAVDFFSGVEIRVFPLYYGPIALAAWSFGRRAANATAMVAALAWFLANQLAGLQYSHPAIWVVNTLVQGTSFVIVGMLVADLHATLLRERLFSRTDALSGLLNQRAFYQEGERVLGLCRRGGRPVTLAYLDLDNFKHVNDTRGHPAGDDLLRAVGAAIQTTVRSSDLAARLGGDEFGVLLPELGPAEARAALNRLRDAIKQVTGASDAAVTVSVGAVTLMVAPADVESIVQQADAVMYQAKGEGKDRLRLEVIGAASAA